MMGMLHGQTATRRPARFDSSLLSGYSTGGQILPDGANPIAVPLAALKDDSPQIWEVLLWKTVRADERFSA